MKLPQELFDFLVKEHDLVIDECLQTKRLRAANSSVRFFLAEAENYRPTGICCKMDRTSLAASGLDVEGFQLFDVVEGHQVGRFFRWPVAGSDQPTATVFAAYSFHRPHRSSSYSLVTVKADPEIVDTYTIVVDHNGTHFPRFLELEKISTLLQNQKIERNESQQAAEIGLPLFDDFHDLFYGGPDQIYSGPRAHENTDEFVVIFFGDASMHRFVRRHSEGWIVYGKSKTRGVHFSVKPTDDSCHLRRVMVPASGFTFDVRRLRQWALVQYRTESALFDIRSGPYRVAGSPLVTSELLTEEELESALNTAKEEGTVLTRFNYFLLDAFKLIYEPDELDYWAIVGGYWRGIDLPDGVGWRSSRIVNRAGIDESQRRSYMPRSSLTSISPWYRCVAEAAGLQCHVDNFELEERLKPLRKTLYWYKGHTLINYFRSSAKVYRTR